MTKSVANVKKFNILEFMRRKTGRSSFFRITLRGSMLCGKAEAEVTHMVIGEKDKDGGCLDR